MQLERRIGWIMLASWIAFYLLGFVIEFALGGSFMDAVQFGSSVLVWGVFVRTVAVWQISWSINSVTHRFGYRNYETDEGSRNSIFTSLSSRPVRDGITPTMPIRVRQTSAIAGGKCMSAI